jgi:dolichyl-phosphate-mannose-protein mannosyltransferase
MSNAENAERVNYRNPGFFGKFWELQKVMWRTNAGLTESHAWDSRPSSWPILARGINFWGRDFRQVYLIGNPCKYTEYLQPSLSENISSTFSPHFHPL